ncbi:DUF2809 domain-containing protein [Myxococcota bacterium]|nr:DUF2809 domain-containing protein [Myxococcota bacterium]
MPTAERPEPADPPSRPRATLPWRARAARWALLVLLVEVVIATRLAHWRWVRASLGDYLVVFIVYFGVLVVRDVAPRRLAAGVFVFAAGVEITQGLGLADALGLRPGGLWHTVLGATFSVEDLLMYALGCATCALLDTHVLRRGRAGARTSR